MDFKQLQYILKIAETKNVTKAAEELFISQPALSHYLFKVEEEFGTKLFDRTTTPISLTMAGEEYVAAAKQILKIGRSLKEAVADITSMKRGKVVIGIPPARGACVLPYIVPRFKAKYPGVILETHERDSKTLKAAILAGRVDFAILPFIDEPGFEGEILFEEELFLVAAAGRLRPEQTRRGGVIDFEKIKDEPFVLLHKNHGIRTAIDAIFMQYGIQPQILMETGSNETACRLAAAGLGLAIVPAMTLYMVKNMEQVEVYHMSESGMKWPLAMVHREGEYLNPLELEIADLIQQFFQENQSRMDSAV